MADEEFAGRTQDADSSVAETDERESATGFEPRLGGRQDNASTVAGVLEARATPAPDRVGFSFLSFRSGGSVDLDDLSYGTLLTRAKAIAARLQGSCSRGDRVLILCPPGLDYIAAFFACQIGGFVAVPAYPPRNVRHLDRLRAIIGDAGAAGVLTTAEVHQRLARWTGEHELLPTSVVVEDAEDVDSIRFADISIDPGDLAFLQYTSGTTGMPKGVMVTHRQVMDNINAIVAELGLSPSDVGVSWLPPYHDMGLIGALLTPVVAGFPARLMTPAAFLQRPARWLEALSLYRATVTTAPNFGWQLCVDETAEEVRETIDLSSLRYALSGAEQVRAATIAAFSSKFAGSGFRSQAFVPVYGMAETVLLTSGTVRSASPPALVLQPDALAAGRVEVVTHTAADGASDHRNSPTVVSCGSALAGHSLVIADPETRREQPAGTVGEIWVAGPSVAAGYWGRPRETKAVFEARLADDPEGGPFLRTGDIGALVGDELYVLGRIKEMVIVRGRNHYAQDIEAVAEAADPILGHHRTVAFALDEAQEERLVILHELTRASMRTLEPDRLADAIRRAVLEAHDIDVAAVAFVKPTRLPRTTSGKLQRGKARDLFVSDTLDTVAARRFAGAAVGNGAEFAGSSPAERRDPGEGLKAFAGSDPEASSLVLLVRDAIADLGGLQPEAVVGSTRLDTLHFDSLQAARLTARIAEATGRTPALSAVFEAETVAELASALETAAADGGSPPIRRTDRSGPLPPSFQQERLWFLDRLEDAAGAAYHIKGAMRLAGRLNVPAFEAALQSVVARHESLRTTFGTDAEGRPLLAIHPAQAWGFALTREDVSHLSRGALHQRLAALLAEPFDLAAGPLFRAQLLTVSDEEHVLVVGGHHAVLDGWSVGLLLKEVSALYRETATGEPAALAELSIDYADYAVWQRQVLSGERLEVEAAWWRNRLSGIPEAIALPTDRPRPAVMDYRGGSVPVDVPAQIVASLKRLAEGAGATLFMALQAALSALLSRLGAGEDVVIGTAVAGRPRTELEGLVGFFANTVALRHRVDGLISFREHLAATKDVVLEAFAHQQVPFERVVEAAEPVRSLSHPPVVQVMLVLQNTPDAAAALTLPDVEASAVRWIAEMAQFELAFSLSETGGGLTGSLSYAAQLFDKATAERLAAMLVRLLSSAVAAPGALLADLTLLDAAERHQVVADFNDTAADDPRNKTVVDLFCDQAAARPEAVAVVDGERRLTYGELDASSNRLARHLIGLGVGPETVVGACFERSAALIVALLGIWKAGGAYLPLDPDYPEERLAFMLEDAGVKTVLTTSAIVAAGRFCPAGGVLGIALDDAEMAAAIADLSGAPLTDAQRLAPLTPATLAYVIYTSGSTGRPKGVCVPCATLVNLAYATLRRSPDRCGINTAFSRAITFDGSLREIVNAICFGGTSTIIQDILQCTELRSLDVASLFISPSTFSHRAQISRKFIDDLPNIVTFAGEAFVVDQDVKALHGAAEARRLFNDYGPTESHAVTSYELNDASLAGATSVPIGRPFSNTQIYVVDGRLEPVPVGVSGELVIGGVQVSRGYLGRAGLTAEKFVADPFSGEAGARLYRTGDLARWRQDGTLEFLGRIDGQMKIRGMRVEPGEIEAALTACEGVAQAVVVARGDHDARLVAYLVPTGEGAGDEALVLDADGLIDLEAVRRQLKRTLPEHMVPSGYVVLSRLPLTASGKVDRRQLPEAEAEMARAAYAAPLGEMEEEVAAAFEAILGVERVGRRDGFFELGGHSLMAVRLVARLEAKTGRTLALRTLFEAPTVADLAAALAGADRTTAPLAPADRSGPLPLSFQQERLWFLDRLEAAALYHLGTAITLTGPLDVAALEAALASVVARHESLRTRFPEVDGVPVQQITPAADGGFDLGKEDGEALSQEAVASHVAALLAAPFDLANGPLFRARLIRLGGDTHVLVVGGHHIVFDGWSVGLLLKEVSALYGAVVTGERAALPELSIQYADYAAWQRQVFAPERLQAETAWWQAYLQGVPEAITLPFDRPRPKVMAHRSGVVPVAIPPAVTERVKALAASQGATLFMALSAALSALLSRLGGDQDLVIATAVAGRPRAELEPLAGFFVNTVAVRHRVDPLTSFRAHLVLTREQVLGALQHAAVPFEQVVEAVAPARSLAHAPLAQVMFVLQNTPDAAATLDLVGVETHPFGTDDQRAQFELQLPFELGLQLREDGGALIGAFGYHDSVFDKETVERLARQFEVYLAALAEMPDDRLDVPEIDLGRIDEGTATLPLSAAQKRIWLTQLLLGDDAPLTVSERLLFNGVLDQDVFLAAAAQMVGECESLRTRVDATPEGPRQLVLGSPHRTAEFLDLTNEPDPDTAARRIIEADAAHPCSFSQTDTCAITLLKLAEDRWVQYNRSHHIYLDGFGAQQSLARLAEIYTARIASRPVPHADVTSVRAGLDEDARYRASPAYRHDQAWWRRYLEDRPEPLTLSGRGPMPLAVPDRIQMGLGRELSARVRAGLKEAGLTSGQFLFALGVIFVARLSGRHDFLVSMMTHGRLGREARAIGGMRANILPVRARIEPSATVAEVIAYLTRQTKAVLRRQRYRYEDLRLDLALAPGERDGFGPIINVQAFDYQLEFGTIVASVENLSSGAALEDAMLTFYDRGGMEEITFDIDYHPSAFAAGEPARHAERLIALAGDIIDGLSCPFATLSILAADERAELVSGFNPPSRGAPPRQTVVEAFMERAAETPEVTALVEGERTLSYRELDHASNRLARALIARGAAHECVVGVALFRSSELIVALLAIWKAGAAYLPLDPDLPQERLVHMATNAGAGITLTKSGIRRVQSLPGMPIVLDDPEFEAEIATYSAQPVADRRTHVSSLAYVLYTSGSTGQPKGVCVAHAALAVLTANQTEHFAVEPGDRVALASSIGFDVFFEEALPALVQGATLVVLSRDDMLDPHALARSIAENEVTTIELSPPVLAGLPDGALAGLKRVLSGGDVLDPALAARIAAEAPLLNSYGPTEATVTCTAAPVAAETLREAELVPIGRPLRHTTAYVVDALLEPCPVGVVGELAIGGLQIARGYLGMPGLTAEKFVADPFSGEAGARLYRTGDLARWRADGTLEFLGRRDAQIKIRGMRVEPGEVEAALKAIEGIADAAVVLQPKQGPAQEQLVAYLVPARDRRKGPTPAQGEDGWTTHDDAAQTAPLSPSSTLDFDDVRATLRRRLPAHMIPSGYAELARLPLTPSRKLDRRALSLLEAVAVRPQYVPPRTVSEAAVANAFATILGVERVGIHDDFFALGGHSLLAVRLARELEALTGQTLPLAALFQRPIVVDLAAALERGEENYRPLRRLSTGAPPPEPSDRFVTVVCIHDVTGLSAPFARLVDPLPNAEVMAIEARGLSAGEQPFASYEEMLGSYLEAITPLAARRPLVLLGWSVGGLIAHDLAGRLAAAGHTPAALVMLDTVKEARTGDSEGGDAAAARDLDTWLQFVVGRVDPEAGAAVAAAPTRSAKLAAMLSSAAIDRLPLPKLKDARPGDLERILQVLHNHVRLLSECPDRRHYDGPALLIRSADSIARRGETDLGWGPLVGNLEIDEVPDGHFAMLAPDAAERIAAKLCAFLRRSFARHGRATSSAEPALHPDQTAE